jgi:hypothetical protein
MFALRFPVLFFVWSSPLIYSREDIIDQLLRVEMNSVFC